MEVESKLLEVLKRENVVGVNEELEGVSGLRHSIPYVIKNNRKPIAVYYPEAATEDAIIKAIVTARDLEIPRIYMHEGNEEGKKLAEKYEEIFIV
jgi:hypothetical protein